MSGNSPIPSRYTGRVPVWAAVTQLSDWKELRMRKVRSVFVSDVHLGCKFGNSEAFLDFLNSVQPESLYIVGDFIDGWRLKRAWHWSDTYSFILKRLVELVRGGTKIYYTPGNHDEFLRDFIYNLGSIEISDEFVHVTADNRRLLIMHGDQFDTVVRNCRWLSMIGDVGYNVLLLINKAFNFVRRKLGFGYWSLSAAIKRKVKQATSFISSFEDVITKYARSRDAVGVICGHIHTPAISERHGIRYYNTGDWVESCTALVEDHAGNIDLVYAPEHYVRSRSRRQDAGMLASGALTVREIPVTRSSENPGGPSESVDSNTLQDIGA